MKNQHLLLYVLVLCLIYGCNSKTPSYTTYTGVVAEQNSLKPIPDLHIRITDGVNLYSEAVTDNAGRFSMDWAHNNDLGQLYLFIDGNSVYPSKSIELVYTEEISYDYGMIYLYNQTDASLYPQIKNVSWDYPDGNQSIRFKDIVIQSEYSISSAYVELSNTEAFDASDKHQLEKLSTGKYTVRINNLTVGKSYYFRVVATNAIGTGKSEVYCREYGFPVPLIKELVNATVSTATIRMGILEEPLSTLDAGLCWSSSHNPSVFDNKQKGGTSGNSDVLLTGLDFRNKTYYVRAYAQNANGTAYSEELILPVNNPYSLPTFSSGGSTYSYMYLGKGTWYEAYNNCKSYVYVFDDWILPSINVLPDLINAYYQLNGESVTLPVWSMRRNDEDENGESETYMITTNSFIMASKSQSAHYYAVRKHLP